MKKQNRFYPAIFQGQTGFLNRIQLSPDAPEGGGGEVTFTEEQEAEIQKRIDAELDKAKPTLKSATDFLKNSGAKVFLSDKQFQDSVTEALQQVTTEHIESPNDLQKSVMKFKSGLIGEVLSPVDQTIKELTGIEKDENEKTRDYAKRALAEIKKDGTIDEGEYNAIKGKLSTANKQIEQLEAKHNNLLKEMEQGELDSFFQKGLPSNLDYQPDELSVMLPGMKAKLEQNYEFKKDERGWVAVNKETGEPELNTEGQRKSVDEVVKEFVSSQKGLRFREGDQGKEGAGLPGEGKKGNMSDEDLAKAQQTWESKLAEKNLIGHEKEAFFLRKEMGLPISKRAVEKWPELETK